ncbi:MAG: hypothetical protein NTW25_03055 [Candidatus Kapabacteria bacterium]|nr:hypothetical protein [Candidatus Kapabacteria bacterium]
MKIAKLLFIFLSFHLFSFGKDSKTTLLFNIDANFNLYNASFVGLKSYPICCTKFTNGFGVAPSINAGIEYQLKSKIIGNDNKYGLTIGYNDLSGMLKQNEFIANKVYPDRVEKVYSDFTFDASLIGINIQNYFITDLPFLDELKFKIFLDAGSFFKHSFSQKEEATSPNDFVFENNKRVRSEEKGEISNMSSLYMAIGAGLSYPIFSFNSIKIYSEISYNYSFTSLINDQQWNVNQLKIGLTAKYKLQKTIKDPIAPELPIELPLPKVPEPPKPDTIFVDLLVDESGRILNNNDTVFIYKDVKEYVESYGFLPVVFYETNSLNFINTDIIGQTNQEQNAQRDMKNQIVSYLNQNVNINANIISYSHTGEKTGIADDRAMEFIKDLSNSGIDKNRLSYKVVINKKLDNKREELTLDNQKLEFEFSNGNKLLQFNYSTKTEENISQFKINVKSITDCTADPCNSIIRLFVNNKLIDEQLNEINDINIKKYNLDLKNLTEMKFIVLANDSKGNSKQNSKEIIFKVVNNSFNKIVNLVENSVANQSYEQYILAFTEFDKSKLIGLNREVLDKIRIAVGLNKKVELLALTDNLGTTEYNKTLSQARAKSALSILNVLDSKINVIYPDDFIFSNKHPYGRLLNRAIIVRIFNN